MNAQQVHDAQGRERISFSALDPTAHVPPLERDERTLLIAAKLSAEQDGEAVRARAAALYHQNTELQAEVRRLRARDTEAQAQLADRDAKIERLLSEKDEVLVTLHDTQEELERIKMLVPVEPPAPSLRGSVVGGPTPRP